jgi:hypothetical protein
MQIYNQTRYVSEFTMGMEKSGREFLSLVIKETRGTSEFKLAFRLMFFGCLNSQEAIEAQNMKLIYTSESEIEFDG